jgi:putative oxidoreductase
MSTVVQSRNTEPKLLVPGLAGFYAATADLSWLLIRVTPAAILFTMHGWVKLNAGITPVIGSMTRYGMYPTSVTAWIVMLNETVGAVCVALGLFTRFFATAIAIEMAVLAFYVHAFWGPAHVRNTFELALTWVAIFLAIALRGGGPYSLDRKLGREL